MQKPSVGRIVHYCHSGQRLAATVTYVHSDTCVNLTVSDQNGGTRGVTSSLHEAEAVDAEAGVRANDLSIQHGHWTWPPRV